MNGWSYYEPTSIGGYNDNPSPIAWDDARFSLGYGGLDKIFASDGDWIVETAGDHGTGASDHPAISAELRLN